MCCYASKSSWSKESGFDIHFNNYRNIKNHINEYSKKQEYKLLNQKNLERMTFLNKKHSLITIVYF